MPFSIQRMAEIYDGMRNRVVARSTLTDLTPTSDVAIMLAAVARGIEKAYLEMVRLLDSVDMSKARGQDLDEWGKRMNPTSISRQSPQTATSTVVFGRTGTTGTVTIPIGTTVQAPAAGKNGEDLVFASTAAGSIANGSSTSAAVAVKAAAAGAEYNVSAGAISTFQNKPSGVETVTNASAVTNGSDEEKDDAYRRRMLARMLSLPRSTMTAIKGALLGVTDGATAKTIRQVTAIEDKYNPGNVEIYIDDGNGTAESTATVTSQGVLTAVGGEVDFPLPHKPIKPGTTFNLYRDWGAGPSLMATTEYTLHLPSGKVLLDSTLYPSGLTASHVITADYTYYTGLVALAQKVVDGDPLDRANYPGYRAAGISAQVKVPQIQSQTVMILLTVKVGFDQATAIAAVSTAVQAYINGLGIGDDVIHSEIVERSMAVSGVYDAKVFLPSANVVISSEQLARVAASQVTVI